MHELTILPVDKGSVSSVANIFTDNLKKFDHIEMVFYNKILAEIISTIVVKFNSIQDII